VEEERGDGKVKNSTAYPAKSGNNLLQISGCRYFPLGTCNLKPETLARK